MTGFSGLQVFFLICFLKFLMLFKVWKTGDRGTPLQAKTGHFSQGENGRFRHRVVQRCHACSPKQSPFWGFALLSTAGLYKTGENKKLLRLSGRRTITVSVFIVGGFIQMYCSRRNGKEQEIVSRPNC